MIGDRVKPMRIALVSPKGPLYRHRGGIFGRGLRYKPLTLPTLAALIPKDLPHTLHCYDEGIQDVPEDLDADLIGLTVLTGSAPRAYALADRWRAAGRSVVLGGPHPTLMPEEAANHADAVVTGYAEDTWPQLLRDFQQGQLQRRYQQSSQLSLADRPRPDRSVLPRLSYITEDVFEATRSCVHQCEFCVAPSAWGRGPYRKPVHEVIADIRAQRARRAIFIDLNLIGDRDYALQLFHALKPLNIHWFGLATTLIGRDQELLQACADSGCRGLLIGFESINQQTLSGLRKGFNDSENFAGLVERLHSHGISLQACFAFGGDDDGPDVFARTAEFAINTGIDLPRFAILTPFPGTPLFHRLHKDNRIVHRNWEQYDGQHAVFTPKLMSAQALEQGTHEAWRRCYSWRGIWSRLRQSAAPWPVAAVTNWTYRRYARNLHRFYTCDVMSWDAPHGVGFA